MLKAIMFAVTSIMLVFHTTDTTSTTKKVVEVVIAPPTPISCMFIGDSTTDSNGDFEQWMVRFQPDNFQLTLMGTRGTAPYLHEGRGGWRTSDYVGKPFVKRQSGEVPNAFYNPETKTFDFSYYMKEQGYSSPDYVFINLGINDTFGFKTDKSLKAEIPKMLARYDLMVDSIRAHDPDIKIGIFVTIPPCASECQFIVDPRTKQTLKRYERNNSLWVAALVKHFEDSTDASLVRVDQAISRACIIGVHPTATGYMQMASGVWEWIKAHK